MFFCRKKPTGRYSGSSYSANLGKSWNNRLLCINMKVIITEEATMYVLCITMCVYGNAAVTTRGMLFTLLCALPQSKMALCKWKWLQWRALKIKNGLGNMLASKKNVNLKRRRLRGYSFYRWDSFHLMFTICTGQQAPFSGQRKRW